MGELGLMVLFGLIGAGLDRFVSPKLEKVFKPEVLPRRNAAATIRQAVRVGMIDADTGSLYCWADQRRPFPRNPAKWPEAWAEAAASRPDMSRGAWTSVVRQARSRSAVGQNEIVPSVAISEELLRRSGIHNRRCA